MAAINELDAFAIAMPEDLSPFAGPDNGMYISVVRDEIVGHHTLDRHVPCQPAWVVIEQICRERARMTVDRELLVNGRPIEPEDYIKRWRTRLGNPVPLARLALDKGLQAVAVFQWRHSPAIAARKARWVNPPFACIGELLDKHGFTTDAAPIDHPALRVSTLKVDLAAPGGARAAWWADDFLCSSAIEDSVICRRVEFHRVPHDAQPAVFHPTHAQPTAMADLMLN